MPVRDISGELVSLQFIDSHGEKRFLPGGAVTGCLHPLGTFDSDTTTIAVAEGFATGETIHEATDIPVAVAFNAGNLRPVAKGLHEKYPAAQLIIAADNDQGKKVNTGLKKGREAAKAVGGVLAVPKFKDVSTKPTDFNDLKRLKNADAVREQIEAAVEVEPEPETNETMIKRLAALSPIAYDQAREKAAEKMNVRLGTLDREVAQERDCAVENEGNGKPFSIDDPEPWGEPVDGDTLFNEIAETIQRFAFVDEKSIVAITLWIVQTYVFELFRVTPILGVTSPQKRCGKTTLLTLLSGLVRRPLAASNVSPSALFRVIEKSRPTLLIDEADTVFRTKNEDPKSAELRGILNSGHSREMGFVIRNVNVGENYEPHSFSVWCPKAVGLIGKLPPTLHDRAIEIRLQRKTKFERVERINLFDGTEIQRKYSRWTTDHKNCIREVEEKLMVPDVLHDRAADNWRSLLALAEVVGGDWPERARTAAIALTEMDDDDDEISIQLLRDIKEIFFAGLALSSSKLADDLGNMDDRPWKEWRRGKPITSRQVAQLLRPFGIAPKPIRFNDGVKRGYEFADFTEVFTRYLPETDPSDTPLQPNGDAGFDETQSVTPKPITDRSVTRSGRVTDGNGEKVNKNNGCNSVTDKTPKNGGRVRMTI